MPKERIRTFFAAIYSGTTLSEVLHMEIYGYIYKITNTRNNKVYIGQTKRNFQERYQAQGVGAERVFNSYLSNKAQGHYYNKHLFHALEKYGCEAFTVDEEYDVAYSKEELDELETKYIKKYRSHLSEYGYNGNTGGYERTPNDEAKKKISDANAGEKNGFYGKHHSEETRQYLSEIKKGTMLGEENPNYGNHWTREQREHLSKIKRGVPNYKLRGRKMSREVVERQRASMREAYASGRVIHPMLGKHHSEETKQKIRAAHVGKGLGAENGNHKPVKCVTTGDVFETINDAARWCGISPTGISTVLHGVRKHAGKKDGKPLEWVFIQNEEEAKMHDNTEPSR